MYSIHTQSENRLYKCEFYDDIKYGSRGISAIEKWSFLTCSEPEHEKNWYLISDIKLNQNAQYQ